MIFAENLEGLKTLFLYVGAVINCFPLKIGSLHVSGVTYFVNF